MALTNLPRTTPALAALYVKSTAPSSPFVRPLPPQPRPALSGSPLPAHQAYQRSVPRTGRAMTTFVPGYTGMMSTTSSVPLSGVTTVEGSTTVLTSNKVSLPDPQQIANYGKQVAGAVGGFLFPNVPSRGTRSPTIFVAYVKGRAVPFIISHGRIVDLSLQEAQFGAHWGWPTYVVAMVAVPRLTPGTTSRSSTGSSQGPFDIALGMAKVEGEFPDELRQFRRYIARQRTVPVLIWYRTGRLRGFGKKVPEFYSALRNAETVHFDLTGIDLDRAELEGRIGALGGIYRGSFTANELMAITTRGGPKESMGKTIFYERGPGGTWTVMENPQFSWRQPEP